LTLISRRRSAQLEKLESKIEHLVNALSTSQTAQKRLQGDGATLSPHSVEGEG